MSRLRLVILLLVLGTLAVYLPVSHYGFSLYDDTDYVTENPMVQNGLTWSGVKWAFTSWHSANWHPITWMSHMLDCELFNLVPGGHHDVNVLFHIANTVLLMVLLLRLTGAFWPAVFVAALFAWHPLHVESVAWISERKDVLSTFFALLTLLCYTRYVTGPHLTLTLSPPIGMGAERGQLANAKNSIKAAKPAADPIYRSLFYWISILFFALALMSKPMFVTLPFVMLLLDFWPLGRVRELRAEIWWKLVLEKIPFLMLVGASCVVTFLAQRHSGAVISLKIVPMELRLENTPVAYVLYLQKMFWPSPLAVFYPFPPVMPTGAVVTSVVLLVCISAASWLARKKSPYLLVGWLWFLGTLVPVIGLVQVGSAAMADRYTYFPSIGIFLAVTLGVRDVSVKFHFPKHFIAIGAVIVAAVCLALTHRQLNYWRDNISLFSHALAVTPDNDLMRLNLGVAYQKSGDQTNAMINYRDALQINSDNPIGHVDLANVLSQTGHTTEALAQYQAALRLQPDSADAHNDLGALYAQLGQFAEAQKQCELAMQLDPTDWHTPYLMGKVLLKQGHDADAIPYLQRSCELARNNPIVLNYAGEVLASDTNSSIRDGQAALSFANRANDLTGGTQPDVLDTLAMAYAEIGQFQEACEAAKTAIQIDTNSGLTNQESQVSARLQLYEKNQPFRQSFAVPPQNDAPKE
ncbi:MAG TPA: tetratricopeptide repeat protein [Verrucomicrobiae bacterium]|jgi:tetratricopeptide (TPR) repeat protein